MAKLRCPNCGTPFDIDGRSLETNRTLLESLPTVQPSTKASRREIQCPESRCRKWIILDPTTSEVGGDAAIVIDDIAYGARRATPEEDRLIEWGWETYKERIPNLIAALQRVMTIDAALIGGSVALLKPDMMANDCRLVVIFLFIISLAATMIGLFPRKGEYDWGGDTKAFKDRIARFKSICLWIAYGFFFLGLVVSTFGIALH